MIYMYKTTLLTLSIIWRPLQIIQSLHNSIVIIIVSNIYRIVGLSIIKMREAHRLQNPDGIAARYNSVGFEYESLPFIFLFLEKKTEP